MSSRRQKKLKFSLVSDTWGEAEPEPVELRVGELTSTTPVEQQPVQPVEQEQGGGGTPLLYHYYYNHNQ